MKLKFLIISLLLLVAAVPVVSTAHEGECSGVYFLNAYARATPEGAPTGAIFGYLVNLGAEADRLVSVETPAAESTELHEMVMGDGDVMQMRPIEGGLEVPSQGFTVLESGGKHIMLINLKKALVAGEMLDVVLHFEHGADLTLSLPIREVTAMENSDMAAMAGDSMPLMTPPMDWGDCAGMHVIGSWVRPAAAGMPNSAAYLLLVNLTDKAETLVKAESDVAASVELHEVVMGDGDVMQMRPVEDGIPVAAGSVVELRPGGFHVMLVSLNHELNEGDQISLKLNFANSNPIDLKVVVHEPQEESSAMSMGSGS